MVEASSSASHSFLLDDDSTLPFVASDILAQMDDKVRPTAAARGGRDAMCMRARGNTLHSVLHAWMHACACSHGMHCTRARRTPALLATPHQSLPVHAAAHRSACLPGQDLYVALPVPEPLKGSDGASAFGFLEKELRFSQM